MNLYKLLPLLALIPHRLLEVQGHEVFLAAGQQQGGQQVNGTVSALLVEAIRARGIDPEKVELALDEQDSRVVHLSLKDTLSPEQREALRALFDDILSARTASSMAIDMTLEPQPGDAPPQPTTLTLSINSEVRLSARYLLLDRALGYYNKSGVPVEIVCNIQGQLDGDLPFNAVSVQQVSGQSPEHVRINYRSQGYRKKTVTGQMIVNDAQLRESMRKGEIRLWGEDMVQDDLLRTKLQLSIEVANLGEQLLTADFSPDNRNDDWNAQCAEKIKQLGRPFSFHIGSGLDRLQSVTYEGDQRK